MDKQIVKKVSKIIGVIVIIFFSYFLFNESWDNAFYIALIFMVLWIFPKWFKYSEEE
jgi:hypothetical protein